MSNPQVLELAGKLNDSPELIGRFRKLLVGLAIAGRLRARDKGDLGIDEVLRALDDSSEEAAGQGQLRRHRKQSRTGTMVLPARIVESDRFVPLGKVARIEKGKTGIKSAVPGSFPLVVTAAQRLTCDHFDFDDAATIVPLVSSTGHGKASLHRLHYQEGKFALGSILAAIFPLNPEVFSARFLFEYLSTFKDELLVSQMIGTANVSLSIEKIANVGIPIIPYSVQRRVDDLMALCDQLEQVRGERESRRDKLTAASLARLNTPNRKSFRDDARFALDHLSSIAARADQIAHLRRAILNLAVRGLLVRQDVHNDGSALLKQVLERRSKQRAGAVPLPVPFEPYSIPKEWQWTTLAAIIVAGPQNGVSPKPTKREDAPKALTLTATTSGRLKLDHFKHVDINLPEDSDLWLQEGDLLFQRGNTQEYVGIAAVFDGPPRKFLFPDLMIRVRISDLVDLAFVHMVAVAPPSRAYLTANATGAQKTMPKINQTSLLALPIPLPSLAEQRRIIEKVNELMFVCDDLELALSAGDAAQGRLLDALLSELLNAPPGSESSYYETAGASLAVTRRRRAS